MQPTIPISSLTLLSLKSLRCAGFRKTRSRLFWILQSENQAENSVYEEEEILGSWKSTILKVVLRMSVESELSSKSNDSYLKIGEQISSRSDERAH